jgi:hypothetical protein
MSQPSKTTTTTTTRIMDGQEERGVYIGMTESLSDVIRRFSQEGEEGHGG